MVDVQSAAAIRSTIFRLLSSVSIGEGEYQGATISKLV